MPPARKQTQKDSLAGAASERVRAIIEAAETSAAAIRAEAESEAERIRAGAEEQASALRSEVRSDVQALIASIRDGVERLRADLERLEHRLVEPEPEATRAAEPVAASDDEPEVALAEDAAVGLDEPQAASARPDPDLEGARLVALNMALDGADRDEVDRYLRDNYELADRAALLDEVYESVGRR
jgi:cell division septum initiation protein DivIVA